MVLIKYLMRLFGIPESQFNAAKSGRPVTKTVTKIIESIGDSCY